MVTSSLRQASNCRSQGEKQPVIVFAGKQVLMVLMALPAILFY